MGGEVLLADMVQRLRRQSGPVGVVWYTVGRAVVLAGVWAEVPRKRCPRAHGALIPAPQWPLAHGSLVQFSLRLTPFEVAVGTWPPLGAVLFFEILQKSPSPSLAVHDDAEASQGQDSGQGAECYPYAGAQRDGTVVGSRDRSQGRRRSRDIHRHGAEGVSGDGDGRSDGRCLLATRVEHH